MDETIARKIKENNDKILKEKGYRVNDWLPIIERTTMKALPEIKGRMSVMNALINISFEAPIYIIKDWIVKHNLYVYLSAWEKEILEKENEELSEYESRSLRWYLEGLWALMWTTKMINDLNETEWCGDNMTSLLPDLQNDDSNEKIESVSELRPEEEIYIMLDYYYRLHWYCVDERLKGKEALINEGLVYERRKALEWLMDKDTDWDNVEMST